MHSMGDSLKSFVRMSLERSSLTILSVLTKLTFRLYLGYTTQFSELQVKMYWWILQEVTPNHKLSKACAI